ncbi:hypothetical protein HDU98_003068 [Podochytrium sp. JEL0797]|nr:hypothetical protein HDU98_003068 [Podochytrium sp. JEL0797]
MTNTSPTSIATQQFWDERFSNTTQDAYGTAPNDFLADPATLAFLAPGSAILSLGEGEGRNAVFLALRGHRVHCVDLSPIGLAKAARAALEGGVADKVTTEVADLSSADLGDARYDAVINIWCHMPDKARRAAHLKAARALKPGGVFIVEGYTKNNIGRGTGGPQLEDQVMGKEVLEADVAAGGLQVVLVREVEREVSEGKFHSGMSATVQMIARK